MPIMWINLDYDKDGKLISAKGKQCSYSDIPSDEIDRLKELSVEYAKSRIESFQRQFHRKVGRNDPCPCESGKKYKKCCL
ncbi:MAG: SEC-C motif domain protein [Bacillota bacterium]|nr:MAG: SEC-C motif domain protein [Bacillota bacterium]